MYIDRSLRSEFLRPFTQILRRDDFSNDEEETAGLLHDAWTANQVHRTHGWVALGDFNGPPPTDDDSDSACGHLFGSWGGYAVTDGKPTRWEGSQAIDWFIAGANTALQWEGQIRYTALSDHIPIRASLVGQSLTTKAWTSQAWH